MQQHTGQHLLSAMFQERFGLPTVSFHLGAEMCSIDLRGPQPTDEILEGAERAANRIVFEDRAVTVRYETQAQLAALRVRKEVEREGILRAIEIEGTDLQPCGGTHVNRTGQIGAVLVRRCTKIRQDWRVEFVCGERARSRARHDFVLVQRAAENLGCASEELPSATARALQERDSNYKNGRLLSQRLAAAEATLAVESTPVDEGNGLRVVARLVEGVQPEFMGAFAAELAKKDGFVALLARPESGELFFSQHPGVGRDMAELLKRVLEKAGGKGGGTRDAARGKLADARKAGEAITRAVGLLKG
jgi:alanyl-tRNA synthetase